MEMRKKEKIKCEKCGKNDFKSYVGLSLHKNKKHPYIPPPAPKKEVIFASPNTLQSHSLINAKGRLSIGDVFYRVEKLVIKKITITENSNTLDVEAEVTKQNWQLEKPE